jgi:hypothetical protein
VGRLASYDVTFPASSAEALARVRASLLPPKVIAAAARWRKPLPGSPSRERYVRERLVTCDDFDRLRAERAALVDDRVAAIRAGQEA